MKRLDATADARDDGSHRVELSDGRYAFIKIRHDVPVDFFAAEARGLAALADTGTLRVPRVFAVSAHSIELEDLGSGHAGTGDWERAGRALASLHRLASDRFGFTADGYCGDSPQDNTSTSDGFAFFAQRRLLPQARRALDHGLIDKRDFDGIEALCGRLREFLPEHPAVLIHGDLWTGNLHACGNGELALIDAGAVHHGWAECDLAMSILFGEPPRPFFAAYEAEAHIGTDWRQRAVLLNLYHLLNHLNLFGSSYLGGVRSAIDRFH